MEALVFRMGHRLRIARFLLLALFTVGLCCDAQTPLPSKPDLQLDRQIELTLRSQFNVPPEYSITLGQRTKSDTVGFDSLPVTFSNGGPQKKVVVFLISKDNTRLARMDVFDLNKNPAAAISTSGRPIRGNPNAKVTVISFDDLECPFCARMNATLFPATEQHYGDLVRYLYLDDPIPQHPWAMHAAVDVNCLAAQNRAGYWALVSYIHAHADEISGNQQSVAESDRRLDELTRQEGQKDNLDTARLDACIAKQDESAIRLSAQQGLALGVDRTPILFINGERTVGALPQDALWKVIDRAIVDSGGTPPPQGNSPAAKSAASPGN